MRDLLLITGLLIFMAAGFPMMARLDRFLKKNLRESTEDLPPKEKKD